MGNFDISKKYLLELYGQEIKKYNKEKVNGLRKTLSDKMAVDNFLKEYEGECITGSKLESEMREYVHSQIEKVK